MNIWLYTILTLVNGLMVSAWLIFLKRFGGI